MQDQPPPPLDPSLLPEPEGGRPRLHVVPSDVRVKRKNADGVTRVMYEAAEKFWLEGTRQPTKLAKYLKTSVKTAMRIVHRGYPKKGWPPLTERALLYDRQQNDARNKAQAQQLEAEASELARARRDNLVVTRALRGTGANLLARINTLVAWVPNAAPASEGEAKKRSVILVATASMYRAVTLGLERASASEMNWIKGAAQESEADRRTAEVLEGLKPEDWEHVFRTGALPPGVPPEALAEMVRIGFKPGP